MFLNAIMLAGLGGAVVPLVLHLLSRSRYKDVDWGAMMFLRGADTRRRHVAKLSQYALLLVRMAIIGLLAVALARPLVQGKMATASPGGKITAALLLDCSASMGYDETGRTRFQMAQAAARQVLRGLRPGDRVCLVLMGAPQNEADLEPTGDLRAVEARIDDAHITFGRANLRDALTRAADVLDRYEKTNRDIYIVCDRQALSWRGIDDRFRAEWQRRMGEQSSAETPSPPSARTTRLFVIPVGGTEADNVAVESMRLMSPPAVFYRRADGIPEPVEVEVKIQNYGTVPRIGLPVMISGGRAAAGHSINLAPNQSATVSVPVILDRPGSFVLAAQIQASGFTGDDRMEMAVDVIDPIAVLVISGDERAGTPGDQSSYFAWALAPHKATGAANADPFTVSVLAADKWADTDLDRYGVVALVNIERFSPAQARSLERYVYGGGRLLIAPGSLSRFEDYNAMLFRDGAGILPARLEAPTPADGSQATTLLSWDTAHPIFQFLRGQYESPSATIARYFPARPRQVDAVPLAWYLTGDPFLIEGRSERGRVLLMTTSLDADWTTLPLSNFYLPFAQSAVRYLAGASSESSNLTPGQPIRLGIDGSAGPRKVTLTRPDGRPESLEVLHVGQQTEVRYADTELPGRYVVRVGPDSAEPAVHFFIVHPPRDESDLTQLTDERWKWLEQALGMQRIDPSARPLRETLASGREGRELWPFLLGGVFALFIIEMLLGRAGAVPRRPTAPSPDLVQGPGAGAVREEVHTS